MRKLTELPAWEEMLKNAWRDYEYKQIIGDLSALFDFSDNIFDIVFCHNVLEYVDDKAEVMHELSRILKPDGVLSLVKHNRIGRVMQMAVLLDDFEKGCFYLNNPFTVSAMPPSLSTETFAFTPSMT